MSVLIKAFKSTLAETVDADIICHVIDIADPKIHQKIKCVEDILKQLGVDEKPKIYVFNKLDKLMVDDITPEVEDNDEQTDEEIDPPEVLAVDKIATLRKDYAEFEPVFLSTYTEEGAEGLKKRLVEGC